MDSAAVWSAEGSRVRSVGHALRYAVSACAVAGLQLTPARRRVLEALASPGIPRIVEPLVRQISAECGVHPVTVYRFVALMEEKGIVYRLALRDHRAVVLACEPMDYLICDRCGELTRLSEPAGFRAWQSILAAESGFRLEHRWFEVSGVCPECQDPASSVTASDIAHAGALESHICPHDSKP